MTIPGNLQRRPFLAPIGLLALTAAFGVLLLIAAAWLFITSTSTTVIVVRHAPQILGGDAGDPPLSAEGEARAAALARVLGDARLKSRVAAIYASQDLRSRATAAPLARSLGITPEVASQDDPGALARRLLGEHSGETVLVVGHAGTVPAIVSALSGQQNLPAVTASDYETMYVVSVPRIGRSVVLRLRY